MNAPVAVGVIGAGRHAVALADHMAPFPRVAVARWSAGPNRGDHAAAVALAGRIGAKFSLEWEEVARDPSLPAVLVLSGASGTVAVVEAALSAGKVVLCPAPAAIRPEDLNRLSAAQSSGRGALLAPGSVRHTPAGREALRLIAGGELGTLNSIFAAVRLPGTAAGEGSSRRQPAVLEETGWEIFDFILAATAAEPLRVHARAEALFGSDAADTVVCIIRFEDDLIATVELSRCLPPAAPAAAEGEVEIEVIGARQAVRLLPYATPVRIYSAGATLRPWLDAPVISMLREVVEMVDRSVPRQDGMVQARRAVALMEAARAAATRAEVSG